MYLEVELLGNMVIVFRKKISRDHQIAFCRGHTILNSHQQCIRIPVSLYPCQSLLFSGFLLKFIVTLLMCVRWYLIILICISLMISDAKHLFMCFLTISLSSLEELKFFAHVLIWQFCFFSLSCRSSLYILDITPYHIYDLQIYSSILQTALSLWIMPFSTQKF